MSVNDVVVDVENVVEEDIHQQIMNEAYEMWQDHDKEAIDDDNYRAQWSFGQFVDECTPIQQVAVTIGKLNEQVGNGGFEQWDDNGYIEALDVLKDSLTLIGTNTANSVMGILDLYTEASEEYTSVYDRLKKCSEEYHPGFDYDIDVDYMIIDKHTFIENSSRRYGMHVDEQYYELETQLLKDTKEYLIKEMEKDANRELVVSQL